MGDTVFHFSVGLLTGTLGLLPLFFVRMRANDKMAPFFALWFGVSFGLALWAIAPGFLAWAGVPRCLLTGWWMNIFLLHPLLNTMKHSGFLVGTVCMFMGVAVMYSALLLVIWKRIDIGKKSHFTRIESDSGPLRDRSPDRRSNPR